MAPVALLWLALLGGPSALAQEPAPEPGPSATFELTSPYEMLLQGESLDESGRPCQAAERYRAVVGELPGAFLRYARAKMRCLEGTKDEG